jgi:tRNA(fMet)-specific endonuclease VapC
VKLVYLLDTNIVSELLRPSPDERVIESMRAYDGTMAIAAIVWHELLYGLARLPEGTRKRRLSAGIYHVIAPAFPVLPYTDSAAVLHADMRAAADAAGRPLSFADGMIAAVARSNNLLLVTRNIDDFAGVPGLPVENWFLGLPGGTGFG